MHALDVVRALQARQQKVFKGETEVQAVVSAADNYCRIVPFKGQPCTVQDGGHEFGLELTELGRSIRPVTDLTEYAASKRKEIPTNQIPPCDTE
jgi:hypothetical protein